MKTSAQNRLIHGLLSELGIPKDSKEDIIHSVTGGRSTSAGDLTFREASNVIKRLEGLKRDMSKKPWSPPNTPENNMRRKIFSIAHEMNWRRNGKVDRDRVNEWVEKYGYLHKPLNKYSAKELPQLITQFENVLKTYYARV